MTIPKTKTCARRRGRLLGGAATLLAMLLAASNAQAQTAPVQASAGQVLANDQSSSAGQILADASGNTVQGVAGPLAGATLSVTDNGVTASGRVNRVVQTIDQAPIDAGTGGAAELTAGASRVTGSSGTLIANRQSVSRTEVDADIFDQIVGLDTGDVAQSRLTVTGNAADTDARGNDATASIAVEANAIRDGIGVVSSQVMASSDGPTARVRHGAELTTGAASASILDLSGNRASAHADGNAADNGLTASADTLFVPLSTSRGGTVSAGTGDASSGAALGLLASQTASGTIKTVAGDADAGGPAFEAKIDGNAGSVSLAADGNTLAAATTANRIANALDADAVQIAPAGSSEGPAPAAIANLTSVQRASGAAVQAVTIGGTIADVQGDVADSTFSLSSNQVSAAATANLVTANRLSLTATMVDPERGALLAPGARVAADGSAAADASVALQNVQDYGTSSVTAAVIAPESKLAAGNVAGTSIAADGNVTDARAAGNRAANGLAVDAGSFGASAALNNVQSGDGNISVTIGAPTVPGGVRISPASLEGSRLSASGNSAAGTALGNAATNSVSVRATELSGGSGPAVSGPIGSGYGATGTLALSSSQKLGEPSPGGTLTPRLSATVYDRVGLGSAMPVTDTSITLDDNRRSAAALGNTAVNRLTLDAASSAPGTGAALASTQYGQANILADLAAATGTSGALDGATVSISGNTSTALAAINDANNAVEADLGSGSEGLGTASVRAAPLGPPAATGDLVLTSQQFATGSVAAHIKTGTGDVESPLGMRDSRYAISGNTNIAEASANRAANSASLTGTDMTRSVGLANSQTSMAQVQASATTGTGYLASAANPVAVAGSTILIEDNVSTALARGNAADNRIALDGATAPGGGATIDTSRGRVDAPAALLNSQANYGAVSAIATGRGYLPLNAGPNAAQASSLTAAGNSTTAGAYGNLANNIVTTTFGQLPGAGLANVQLNHGSVSAQVTGTGVLYQSGPITGSTASISGNSLAATAVGNQATSAIASPR